jgi:hypothetical protein
MRTALGGSWGECLLLGCAAYERYRGLNHNFKHKLFAYRRLAIEDIVQEQRPTYA